MTRKKKTSKKKTARKTAKKKVDVSKLGESAALRVAKLPDTSKADLKKLAGRFDRVDRALAKRDDLSAALLETLSHSSDRITRRNVAANPNCGPKILLHLIFFDAVCALLKGDVQDERSSVGANPNCPSQDLQKLAADGDTEVRVNVAENPSCPTNLLEKLTTDRSSEVRGSVANNPNCPANLLEKLATDRSSEVRGSVANNPNCPAKVLDKLASDKDEDIRCAIADKRNCPANLLVRLAADESSWVRGSVTNNPNCPAELLAELAVDEDEVVRLRVAEHSQCPAEALEKLAMDKDSTIRLVVASNPNCPTAALHLLAKNRKGSTRDHFTNTRDHYIGIRVAEHNNCPREALKTLLNDANWFVVRAAMSNGRCTENLRRKTVQRILLQGSVKLRSSAAEDWGKPGLRSRELVNALAADKSPLVRKALAGNPSCPSSLYKQLLNDNDDTVRMATALNTSHPVYDALIRRKPASSPWLQAQLAKTESKFPGITAAVQEGNILFPAPKTDKALRSTSLLGRIIALSQPNAPPAELARASGYRDWRQRMAIARNPATPPKILEKLSEDSNRYVAAQASATLYRDEKKSKALASKIKAAKTSSTADVDYRLLNEWIGERLRKKAGEEWFHIGPAKLVSRPVEAWAAYVPLSEWWNPNSLTVGKVQQAWTSQYGKRSPSLVKLLTGESAVIDDDLEEKLASSRHSSGELLQHLSTSETSAIRQAVAENSTCPAGLLARLSRDRSRNVRLAVASNPKCPAKLLANLLKNLATSKDFGVRQQVAENPRCPADLLEMLALDKREWVRSQVAKHSKCPVDLLDKLATDKKASVREAVAEHPKCPADLLEKLARDNVSVREAVAKHPRCPASLLEKLARDNSDWVRRDISDRHNCPAQVLEILAMDKDEEIRKRAKYKLARRRKNAQNR